MTYDVSVGSRAAVCSLQPHWCMELKLVSVNMPEKLVCY